MTKGRLTFTTGRFTPSDTFVRIQSVPDLVTYVRARQRHHERMTLEAVHFYAWRGGKLGFMPYFIRSADDLGQQLPGTGKAEYWCRQGIRVLNLGPGLGTSPTGLRVAPPNTRVKLAAPFCCGGHPFVNVLVSRRSLRAFR